MVSIFDQTCLRTIFTMLRRVGINFARTLTRAVSLQGTSRLVIRNYATLEPLGDKTIEHNTKTETNRLLKTLHKFWDKADIKYNEATNHYDIQLDGKTMKTPLGFPLLIPADKKDLAQLIAQEWSNLGSAKVKPSSLPLTSLAARTIDLKRTNVSEDPELVAKVGLLDDVKYEFLRYLNTDTCLVFAPMDECDGKLRKRQDELYMPLIAEYEDFFTKWGKKQGLLPTPEYKVKLNYLDCETDGIRGNDQNLTTQNIVLNWLDTLPTADVVAIEKAILTAKSFLCGALVLRLNCGDATRMKELYQFNKDGPETYFHITVPEIVELGNMETIFQTAEWGEVEDTHDVDKVDWLRNLTAAALLCH